MSHQKAKKTYIIQLKSKNSKTTWTFGQTITSLSHGWIFNWENARKNKCLAKIAIMLKKRISRKCKENTKGTWDSTLTIKTFLIAYTSKKVQNPCFSQSSMKKFLIHSNKDTIQLDILAFQTIKPKAFSI